MQVLELFVDILKSLRRVADHRAGNFTSPGFVRFFAMLAELDDDYFQTLDAHTPSSSSAS